MRLFKIKYFILFQMLQCNNNLLYKILLQTFTREYFLVMSNKQKRKRAFHALLMHIAGKKIVNVASLLIFLFTCKEAMTFLTPFSLFRPVTAADVVKSGATLASQVVHYPGWCYRLNIGRLFCCWNKQIINVFMFLSKIIVKQTSYLHQNYYKSCSKIKFANHLFSKWMHFNISIIFFF